MSRLMRLCCLCLLTLALPLQGLAAVAWLHGVPGSAGAGRLAAASPATVPLAHTVPMAHTALATADDATLVMPACHDAAAATHDSSGPDAPQHAGCSACAACCGHGTAPPAVLRLAPRLPLPAAAPLQRATPAVAPWVTDGIERPPRG